MSKTLRLVLLVGLSALFLTGAFWRFQALSQTAQSSVDQPEILPGRIVVKLRQGNSSLSKTIENAFLAEPSLSKRLATFGVTNALKVFPEEQKLRGPEFPDLSGIFELSFPHSRDPREVAESFSEDPMVEYAEPRYVRYLHFIPNDSLFQLQDHLGLIEAELAWDVEQGDTAVVIGIVDSGVDWLHPDLSANIWQNPGEIPDNGLDDDGNGYIDDVRGWDVGDSDNDPRNTRPNDGASHGTLVAGVAGAVTNNAAGIAGIGFNCRIMPVKVISSQAEDQRNLIFGFEGIKYAAENGADIINASWGGPGRSAFEQDIIRFAVAHGSLIVASAGNGGNTTPNYPAAYEGVLSVTAVNSSRQKPSFSSFGNWVRLAAPGVGILTTRRDAGFEAATGTSFASPMASGIAALVKSQNPTWRPEQIREQVRVTASDLNAVNPTFEDQLGKGLLNGFAALSKTGPSLEITEVIFDDSQGNGNGIPEAGEVIDASLSVHNLLASATNVNFQINIGTTAITILDDHIKIASVPQDKTVTSDSDHFTFRISNQAGRGSNFTFTLSMFTDDGQYLDRAQLRLTVSPTFLDHHAGNVNLTMTSRGSLGFNDFPANQQGTGFIYNRDGRNLLYEGAIVVGVNPRQVSDVARRNNQGVRNGDFQILSGNAVAFERPGKLADEQSIAVFSDRFRPLTAVGVDVTQESFGFAHAPNDDFVLLKYTIHNRSVTTVRDSLYFGLFLDWNIPDDDFKTNLVGFDEEVAFGYMYSPNFPTYCGVKVLNERGTASYRALRGEELLDETGQFSRDMKYRFLSEGLVKTSEERPGDNSHFISTGPFRILPKESAVAGFALVAGTGLEDALKNAQAAQLKWNQIIGHNLPGNLPTEFRLKQNYPNPFNPSTSLEYELPEPTRVIVAIYNVLGQEVVTITDANLEAGRHVAIWDGLNSRGLAASTGVYIAQLRTPNFAQSVKMLLLR